MKPMLAVNLPSMTEATIKTLKFPFFGSPKVDGVRCLVINRIAYSRNLKPIRNVFVQKALGREEYNGFDGELVVGNPTAEDTYRTTNSIVSSISKQPEGLKFLVFDDVTSCLNQFKTRSDLVKDRVKQANDPVLAVLPQTELGSYAEILQLETELLQEGYEGLMLKGKHSAYKFGRTTAREGTFFKVKRFSDSEAVVLGFEELLHNNNAKTVSELGNSVRSSHAAGLTHSGLMGALLVRDLLTGVEFSIGSGFTAEERQHIWENEEQYLYRVCSYKHFEIGVKDKPRHPVFKGFRAMD